MKKVLFLIDNLNAGGAEKSLVTLLNNFDFDKYDVTLFLLSKEGVYLKELNNKIKLKYIFDIEGCKIKVLLNKVIRKMFFWFISKSKLLNKWKNIINNILDDEYDTYISFMEGISTKIIDLIAPLDKNRIAWVHTDVSTYTWYKKYYKSKIEELDCYRRYNHIVCVSKDSKKGFEKSYFINDCVKVIYNALDKDIIYKKSKEKVNLSDKLNICCIGRLEHEKGQDILINALSKVNKDIKLYLLGDGSNRKKLENLVEELGLSDNVDFIGFEENPYKYIKNCDVVISPSRHEGFSLVVAESIILEKMIISTKCSGPVEILDNGKYGILVENQDDLSININKILKDKNIIEKYEYLSRERKSIFDIKLTIDKVCNLI